MKKSSFFKIAAVEPKVKEKAQGHWTFRAGFILGAENQIQVSKVWARRIRATRNVLDFMVVLKAQGDAQAHLFLFPTS